MAQRNDRTVRLSVLDRLIDYEPGLAADRTITWDESVRRMKLAVLRDVEWLLNTRRIVEPAPDEYPEVQASVYHFGIPDVSSMSADSESARQRLMRNIEEAIETFEPRLTQVRVLPVEGGTEQREIHFMVDAVLRLDPDPERVIFDTVLETSSGEFRVSGSANA